MAYYPTESQVKRNIKMLEMIRAAMDDEREIIISTANNQSPGGAKYWLRNLFASADQYPDYGFAGLGARTVVSIMDDGRIRCYPSDKPRATAPVIRELDEMFALSEAMNRKTLLSLSFVPSEDYEEKALRDALHSLGYHEVELDKVGDRLYLESKLDEDDNESSPFDII